MRKDYSLEGIWTYSLDELYDERGFVCEALRQDWSHLIEEWIAQINLSCTYPNVVRAWHRHLRGQVDYFLTIKGAIKICAYDKETGRLAEVFCSGEAPLLVRIPGHYYHGIKSLGSEPALVVYFVTRLYDRDHPDEERRIWNDASIIPSEINGSRDDIRVGKPWDWFYPPHK